MGFKDYGFGYRNFILMREHSGTFILVEIYVNFYYLSGLGTR